MIIVETWPASLEKISKKAMKENAGYAGREAGVHHLSPSSINSLFECSYSFKLRLEHRTFGLQATLGSLLHNVLEAVAKFPGGLKKSLAGKDWFEDLKNDVLTEVIGGAIADLTLGKVSIAANVDPVIAKEIRDGDLLYELGREVLRAMTEGKVNEILYGDSTPFLVEVEVAGIIGGTSVPYMGKVDRFSQTKDGTVFIDDYKSIWSPASLSGWKKTIETRIPPFQFWVYKELSKETIDQYSPEPVTNLVPRVIALVMPHLAIAKAMSKRSKDTLTTVLAKAKKVKNPELVVMIGELDSTYLDRKYMADVKRADEFIKHGLTVYANTKYGCDYCSYAEWCPLVKGGEK